MTSGVLCTTAPGLEDVCAQELGEITGKPVHENYLGVRGRVLVKCSEYEALDIAREINRRSLTIHRAAVLLGGFEIEHRDERGLEEIRERCQELPFERYIHEHDTFGVRPSRLGEHDFTSVDVGAAVGDAVIERIKREEGFRPQVDLDAPSVIVRADVVGDTVIVGVCTTGDRSLHQRGYRVYDHPASLNPVIAQGMLELAGNPDSLIDPTCGGATVPIEALLRNPETEAVGVEKFRTHYEGARLNVLAARVDVELYLADATRLFEEVPELRDCEFDAAVFNPPYGLKIANPRVVKTLYRGLARVLSDLVSVAVTVTPRDNWMRAAMEEYGFRLSHDRWVRHGGLDVRLLVFR
ncbi:THUMP domain-containing protein [Methanopyrus sp.]